MRSIILVLACAACALASGFELGVTTGRVEGILETGPVDFDLSLKVKYQDINIKDWSYLETTTGLSALFLKRDFGVLASGWGMEYLLLGVRTAGTGSLRFSNAFTLVKSRLACPINDRVALFLDSRILSLRNIDFAGKDYRSNALSFGLMDSEIGIKIGFR